MNHTQRNRRKFLHLALMTLAAGSLLGSRITCSGGTSPSEPGGNRLEIQVEAARTGPAAETMEGAAEGAPEPLATTP
jgi:hypothetical protein